MINRFFASTHPIKKRIKYLSVYFILSIFVVIILYILSSKINNQPNGFKRLFAPTSIVPNRALKIERSSFYISGLSSNSIYIGNYDIPTKVLITNYNLQNVQMETLKVPDTVKSIWGSAIVTIDSPIVYMTEGRSPILLEGTLKTLNLSPIKNKLFFFSSVPISPNSFAFRIYDETLDKAILVKKSIYNPSIQKAPEILEKQIDGIFCTDGMLHYNSYLNYLIYIYSYRNQFICLDTNLNVVYKGRTIDTIHNAQIKISKIASDKAVSLSAPPLIVNKKSCISDKWIFINSGLKSDNENKEKFKNSSVIDVYSLKNGEYQLSFYLPDLNGKKVKNFKVMNNTLVVLYDQYICTYTLNF